MGTSLNFASLLSGRNPSGAGGTATDLPATGSSSGVNPMLAYSNLPTSATATNPFDPTSVVPTFGANSGPYQSTSLTGTGGTATGGTSTGIAGAGLGGAFSGMTQSGYDNFLHELNKTYGEGVGSLIASFLESGAGFNQDAINNIFAALQPGINQGEQNLMQQFSTSGNRFGSGAQIGTADYLSQVNLNEGQIESQMYEQSVSNYMNVLMDVGGQNASRIANSPSFLDTLSGLLGAGSSAVSSLGGVSGIQSLISSLGGGGAQVQGGVPQDPAGANIGGIIAGLTAPQETSSQIGLDLLPTP